MIAKQLPFGSRLTAIYVAALAVAIVAFASITFFLVDATIERTLDSRLATAVNALRSIVDVNHGNISFEPSDRKQFISLLGGHLDGAITDAGNDVIAASVAQIPPQIVDSISGAAASTDVENIRLRVAGEDLDLEIAPIVEGIRPIGHIAIWQSRTSYYEVTRITLLALLGIGAAVLGLAIVIGMAFARRATRPLRDLASMISEIEAHDLSERLAWHGPNDELGQLCATFDRLLDRLQDAFERRRRFAADASHELRTPLSVVRAELDLALRKPRDAEEYRTTLETIRSEVSRLETITESLLASARADGGAVRVAPLDITWLIESVAARMTPLTAERGIALGTQVEAKLVVSADATLLERALAALLENALRYAAAEISISAASNGTQVDLTVRDDGPGFSGDALRMGSERFWHESVSGHRGTGLGLAIVKSVVESFGGTLLLEQAPGGGAQVTMRLPLAPGTAS